MRLLEHRHLCRSVVAAHHQAAMGLQVALCRQGHISGDLTREFTVPISLLMHPGSYAVSSPCAWLQTLALTSQHLQELAGPWGGGGGGGGGGRG